MEPAEIFFIFKRKLKHYKVKFRDFNGYFSKNKKCESLILLGRKTKLIVCVF